MEVERSNDIKMYMTLQVMNKNIKVIKGLRQNKMSKPFYFITYLLYH